MWAMMFFGGEAGVRSVGILHSADVRRRKGQLALPVKQVGTFFFAHLQTVINVWYGKLLM